MRIICPAGVGHEYHSLDVSLIPNVLCYLQVSSYAVVKAQKPSVYIPSTQTITITGCPVPSTTPLIRINPPEVSAVTSSYYWTILRTMNPGSVSTAYGEYKVVNHTVTYKRSVSTRPRTYNVKGSLTLSNPSSAAVQVKSVMVHISRGPLTPIMVKAVCSNTNVLAAATEVNRVAPMKCQFSTPYPDPQPGVISVVVSLANGKTVGGSNVHKFDFSKAASLTIGDCATISDEMAIKGTKALGNPNFVGLKPPSVNSPMRVCKTVSFSRMDQYGPFEQSKCGSYQVSLEVM